MPTCRKCKRTFPNRINIDGETKVVNSRKFCLDCSPFGNHNTRDLTKQDPTTASTKFCAKCQQMLPLPEFYSYKRGPSSYCKNCSKQYVKERHHKSKQQCVEYKGGKCSICGYEKCLSALEFHHNDPNQKDLKLSSYMARSLEALKSELDKCSLVCANCHRELHEQLKQPSCACEPGGI